MDKSAQKPWEPVGALGKVNHPDRGHSNHRIIGWRIKDEGTLYDQLSRLDAAPPAQSEQASQPQWIPVSERMPENQVDVLVAIKYQEQPSMAHFNEHGKCWYETAEYADVRGDAWLDNEIRAEITHWMPLPALPESAI